MLRLKNACLIDEISSLQYQEYHRSLDTGEKKLSRSASMITREPASNLIKGKSMPSLRYALPHSLKLFFHYSIRTYIDRIITYSTNLVALLTHYETLSRLVNIYSYIFNYFLTNHLKPNSN